MPRMRASIAPGQVLAKLAADVVGEAGLGAADLHIGDGLEAPGDGVAVAAGHQAPFGQLMAGDHGQPSTDGRGIQSGQSSSVSMTLT